MAVCEPVELAYLSSLSLPFHLIKVEFSETEGGKTMESIVATEVEMIGKNPYHRKYVAAVQTVFLIVNLMMLVRFFPSVS